jgi:hypothetical protein
MATSFPQTRQNTAGAVVERLLVTYRARFEWTMSAIAHGGWVDFENAVFSTDTAA